MRKNISKHTMKLIKIEKTTLIRPRLKKYNKEVLINSGFDVLEYYGVMRKYLQWKYDISIEDLELLYYLYPRSLFTFKDYKRFPVRWGSNRFKNLIKNEFIVSVFPERQRNRVYKLTLKSQIVVRTAHEMLSGQMKIPIKPSENKSFRQDATYSQKKFRTIMQDMRELVSQKFKAR